MTDFITNNLETQNTDRARPDVFCFFFRLNKIARNYNRDLTPYDIEKCNKGTIVIDGDNGVSNDLGFCLKLKVERRD